jgi:predicted HTH transcriptional regulator
MASIDFDAIDEKLLQSLVDEGVLEDINLEYKRELPSKICETQLNKTEKKEILQDISAFANTDGGLLIYGIEDRKGVPKALVGLSFSKEQSTAIRDKISDYVKYNLEPPIYSIDFRDIDVLQSKVAFVFRIRKSVNAPHRIKLKDSDVFYGRRSNGVYPMNVDDMRAAFTLSEARTQMIRSFKNSSVSYAPYDADSVLPFKTDAKILLHLIPADAFVAGKRFIQRLRSTKADVPSSGRL